MQAVSERGTNGVLVAGAQRSEQEEVEDVRSTDHDEERHCRCEDPELGPDLTDETIHERHRVDSPSLVYFFPIRFQARVQGGQLLLCRGQARAVGEPCDADETAPVPAVDRVGLEIERPPELSEIQVGDAKIGGQHADHRVGHTLQSE